MVWIQFPWLRRGQSLSLEHSFFSPNSLEVRIICNDALQVKSLAWQYAWLIGGWNLKTSRKLKIEWGWRSTLCRGTWNYH
jgi:hypothetical protein